MQVILTATGSLAGNVSLKPTSSDSLWCRRLGSAASCALRDGATGVLVVEDIICSRLAVRLTMESAGCTRRGNALCYRPLSMLSRRIAIASAAG
jgi:hypothetical protein